MLFPLTGTQKHVYTIWFSKGSQLGSGIMNVQDLVHRIRIFPSQQMYSDPIREVFEDLFTQLLHFTE